MERKNGKKGSSKTFRTVRDFPSLTNRTTISGGGYTRARARASTSTRHAFVGFRGIMERGP